MITLTISEVRDRLFNKEMLKLLVEDFEAGYAMSSMDSLESADYFNKSIDKRADMISKHIQNHLETTLCNNIKEILKEDSCDS